jgi:3,4-dihydroxy 2-butanone 4-phosphate synthase/GTP cyclohydrolase II
MTGPGSDGLAGYDAIEKALDTLREGRLVIVVDAAERENEGDFIAAAETITPETVDFMLSGRGVLCAPMTHEVAERLHLQPLAAGERNTSAFATPFLMPVDHRETTTGVSPEDRALTIQRLAAPDSTAEEFLRPGHINPLLAKDGGVLRRAGHTEATVDLMRMAGLRPVGCLIEILSRSGRGMANFAELKQLSAEHGIPIIAIEDLIRYRRVREQLIHREAEVVIPTDHYGSPKLIGYRVEHEAQEPLAMVWGDLRHAEKPPLVRMHSSCFTGDLMDSLRCDCGDQLHSAMAMIHHEGTGAIVYLPQEGRGIGLLAKLKAYQLQDEGHDTVQANELLGFKADHRDYMVGLQILKDLGLREIRLLTNNPKKTDAFTLAGMDLRVVEQVPLIAPPPHEHRARYLAAKRDKLGHQLPGAPPADEQNG